MYRHCPIVGGVDTKSNIIMRHPIALLMNDLHISKDNISEFRANWKEALEICKKNQIYDIVIGGDVFTARAAQTLSVLLTVQQCYLDATNMGVRLTIAEGNHDKVNQELVDGYNHLYSTYKNIDVVDRYVAIQWEDCDITLVVMSYFPELGGFKEHLDMAIHKLETLGVRLGQAILYIHEEIVGSISGMELPNECPQEWFTGFKSVLVGHIHNRIAIKGTNIEYIGSSRQNTFGEDEEKGYTILFDDGSYEFVKNEVNTRFKTIEIGYEDINVIEPCDDKRYKVRVKIHCTDAQAKLVDRQSLLKIVNKVELVTEKTKAVKVNESDISVKFDRAGIKKEYVDYCNEKSIDSELGMSYLNKIN